MQATCDRVLIINDGRIVADGSPEQLQQEFHGAESLTVELKTAAADPVQELLPVIRSLEGVTGVTLLAHEGGTSRFELQTGKGVDVREAAFRLAVNKGWVLLEMQRKVTTLEEVFHKLTTQ